MSGSSTKAVEDALVSAKTLFPDKFPALQKRKDDLVNESRMAHSKITDALTNFAHNLDFEEQAYNALDTRYSALEKFDRDLTALLNRDDFSAVLNQFVREFAAALLPEVYSLLELLVMAQRASKAKRTLTNDEISKRTERAKELYLIGNSILLSRQSHRSRQGGREQLHQLRKELKDEGIIFDLTEKECKDRDLPLNLMVI